MQSDERRALVTKLETARKRKNEIAAVLPNVPREDRAKLLQEAVSIVREMEALELELLPEITKGAAS
ncbi:MAG TPA: hypothetical protein VFA98_13185 [Thermoanaerobaculia bacterium]|nr:hypothetical protein [Thermoanaerobaculia bacterium]